MYGGNNGKVLTITPLRPSRKGQPKAKCAISFG